MAATRQQNVSANMVPVSGVSDRSVTAGAAASAFIVAALSEQTTVVYWTLTGANARVTFDGSDPTASNGHQYVNGATQEWSPIRAQAARIIREAGTDAVFHITEMNYR